MECTNSRGGSCAGCIRGKITMIKTVKYLYAIGFCIVLSVFTIAAQAEAKEGSSLEFFKQKLQCIGCDLGNINLSHYDPNDLLQTPDSMKSCVMDVVVSGADMSQANMNNAKFIACGRAGTVTPFRKVDFSNVNFSSADLPHAEFYAVNFSGANFSQANLTNTDLSLSNFSHANFTGANLGHTLSHRDVMQGWGANFNQTDFTKANLSNASLYGFFQGANFTGAGLKHTILNSTIDSVPIGITNVTSAELFAGADFTDADLEGAYLLSDSAAYNAPENAKKADLSQAILCRTKMQDGSSNNRDCP